MSRLKLELCSCVVKENYGELVEKVAVCIAKNGPSQLKTVIKRTGCNVKHVSLIYRSVSSRFAETRFAEIRVILVFSRFAETHFAETRFAETRFAEIRVQG